MKDFIKKHPYMTMFIVLSILATIRYFFLKKIIEDAINVVPINATNSNTYGVLANPENNNFDPTNFGYNPNIKIEEQW